MENRKGLEPRQEAFPLQIDAQYIVGMSWTRQYGFRVAKGFNNKAWLGFSVENPQINGLGGQGLPNQVILGAPGSSGGLYNPSATYSFNVAPDFVVKAAFEPGIGHYEVFGVVSQFRDRIYPCFLVSATTSCQGVTGPSARGAFNDMKTGGGVGANARLVVLNKHLELAGHALAGNGIGRYGNAGLPDLTLHPDGTIALIRNYQSLGTIEYHNAKWDLYVYGGGEYDGRRAFLNVAGAGIGNALGNLAAEDQYMKNCLILDGWKRAPHGQGAPAAAAARRRRRSPRRGPLPSGARAPARGPCPSPWW